jgi:hypothetical protein
LKRFTFVAETLGAVIIGMVIVVLALAKLGDAVPRAWGFVKATARVPLILESIFEEFTPNGGGSLRDKVDVAATHTEQIHQEVVALRTAVDRVQTEGSDPLKALVIRVDAVEGNLASLDRRVRSVESD